MAACRFKPPYSSACLQATNCLPLTLLPAPLPLSIMLCTLHVQAMDGIMSLEDALEQRLQVINCTPTDIQAFLRAYPPESRLTPVGGWGSAVPCPALPPPPLLPPAAGTLAQSVLSCWWPLLAYLLVGGVMRGACLPACLVQGARELIQQLQNRGVAVYLIR